MAYSLYLNRRVCESEEEMSGARERIGARKSDEESSCSVRVNACLVCAQDAMCGGVVGVMWKPRMFEPIKFSLARRAQSRLTLPAGLSLSSFFLLSHDTSV